MRLSPQELKEMVAKEAARRPSGSIKDLTAAEAAQCLNYLETEAYKLKVSLNGERVVEPRKGKNYSPILVKGTPEAKMANKVKYYARQMMWTKQVADKEVVDFDRLDAWLTSKGKYHKKLNAHTHDELVELVSQMELVYKSFLKDIRKKN